MTPRLASLLEGHTPHGCITQNIEHRCDVQAAESPKDFIHKMRVALKELRESFRWLMLIERVSLIHSLDEELVDLIQETDELIRIFVASIRTAESNSRR